MIFFQSLDHKKECIGIYSSGKIIKKTFPEGPKATWKHDYSLPFNAVSANIWANTDNIGDSVPENLKLEWKIINEKYKAFQKSLLIAKVNLEDNCFYDLVPYSFLKEYFDIQNEICKYVLTTKDKPNNYEMRYNLQRVLYNISKNKLKTKLNKTKYINYEMFKSVTGRLSTKKNSFPILSLKKELRNLVYPTNDYFLEIDFNSVDLRVMLSLLDLEQPNEDIHEWNRKNLFNNSLTREESKTEIFAWLYDASRENKKLLEIYDRQLIKEKYWDGNKVINPFGRIIQCDTSHAVSYVIQSTTADIVFRRLIEIDNFLKNKKSFIAFTVHDNVVIDISKEEFNLFSKIKDIFEKTELGTYKTNAYLGKTWGDLKKI